MSNLTWVTCTTVSFATATSISRNLPAGLQDKDGVFAFVMARSALTAAAGWSLITSVSFTASPTTQTLYLYQKNTVASGDSGSSHTWTQASSGRMAVSYAVVRGSGQKPFAQETSTSSLTSTSFTITPPALTSERNNEVFLIGVSSIEALNSAATPTAPTGSTLFTGSSLGDYRMAGAYISRSEGQANSGTFNIQPGQSSTTNSLGAITARIVDNDFSPAAASMNLAGSAPVLGGLGGSRVTVFQY